MGAHFNSLAGLFSLLTLLFASLAGSPARAEEGMWVFNNLPKDQIRRKYGFDLSEAWAQHIMRSSVRFNDGGSGSFVSHDGLILTNHHVAAGTLQNISTPEHDYYRNAFCAPTLDKEIPAPDLELNMLMSVQD